MDVPDPLPLRNIPVPAEVTAVAGCTCGGTEYHRVQSDYDPPGSGCSIWAVPPAEAQAAIDAARSRVREFTDALTASLRGVTVGHFAVERGPDGRPVSLTPISGRVDFDGERYIVREEPP
jgi:hypothetical protein